MSAENTELLSKIDILRNDIARHLQVLNIEAIWLFLATLGCWSVDIEWVRILAVGIVFVLFFYKVYENKKDDRSWGQRINQILEEIKLSNIDEDFKKARMYDLDIIKKDKLSFKNIYKTTPTFLICYLFWIISVFTFTKNYL